MKNNDSVSEAVFDSKMRNKMLDLLYHMADLLDEVSDARISGLDFSKNAKAAIVRANYVLEENGRKQFVSPTEEELLDYRNQEPFTEYFDKYDGVLPGDLGTDKP
jgi:hypothetical protein